MMMLIVLRPSNHTLALKDIPRGNRLGQDTLDTLKEMLAEPVTAQPGKRAGCG